MKYTITTHGGETYEAEGTEVQVDPGNTNRVTILKGDKIVVQENNASSVRPKNA